MEKFGKMKPTMLHIYKTDVPDLQNVILAWSHQLDTNRNPDEEMLKNNPELMR